MATASHNFDEDISVEDFKDHVCARAYDVLSENRFRKHLVKVHFRRSVAFPCLSSYRAKC